MKESRAQSSGLVLLWGNPCCATLSHSRVQWVNLLRKLSHLISGMNNMDVCWCHCCTELLCSHSRERGSPRAQLKSPKCRCQERAGWIPILSGFLSEAALGWVAQIWHIHHIYLGPVRSTTLPASESPCRPPRWTSPADLCDLQVHVSFLLGSESGCLDPSLNIRRTLHIGRAAPWDSCI